MLPPLLLANAFPMLTQFGVEIGGLALTYFGIGWALFLYFKKKAEEKAAAEKAKEAAETERIRQAAYARIEKLEASVKTFIDKEKLDERFNHLGKQIGDNQGAIKTTHDRGEEVTNKLELRVNTLEFNHNNIAGIPMQVDNLKQDHTRLSSKVDGIVTNQERMERKQDEHFRETMSMMKELHFTMGQIKQANDK